MGLIDFVKSAGSKIFGGGDTPSPKAAEASTEDKLRILKQKREEALRKEIAKHSLGAEGVEIEIDGDIVRLKGEAPDQATREKIILAVGNIHGVGQVDDQLSVSTAEPEATYYTVVRGDTLSKIAKEHYGNAMKYPTIFEANKPMLSDPDKIYPGQVLRIPPID